MQNARHLEERYHGFIFSGDSRTFQEEQQMFLIRSASGVDIWQCGPTKCLQLNFVTSMYGASRIHESLTAGGGWLRTFAQVRWSQHGGHTLGEKKDFPHRGTLTIAKARKSTKTP